MGSGNAAATKPDRTDPFNFPEESADFSAWRVHGNEDFEQICILSSTQAVSWGHLPPILLGKLPRLSGKTHDIAKRSGIWHT
jgi:hypothetical protein